MSTWKAWKFFWIFTAIASAFLLLFGAGMPSIEEYNESDIEDFYVEENQNNNEYQSIPVFSINSKQNKNIKISTNSNSINSALLLEEENFDKESYLENFLNEIPTDSELVITKNINGSAYQISITEKANPANTIFYENKFKLAATVEPSLNEAEETSIEFNLEKALEGIKQNSNNSQKELLIVTSSSEKNQNTYKITNQEKFFVLGLVTVELSSPLDGKNTSTTTSYTTSSTSNNPTTTSSYTTSTTTRPSSSTTSSSQTTSSSTTPTTTSTSSSTSSSYYHKVCEDGYCRLKPSQQQWADECDNNTECHHYQCNDNFACEKKNSPGADHPDCADNHFGTCGRSICEGAACVKKKGKELQSGETSCNEYGNGSECRHWECQNYACIEVPGPLKEGQKADCTGASDICFHTQCLSGSCAKINGKGSFECDPSTAGQGLNIKECWRTECSEAQLRCIAIPEPGEKECKGGEDEGVCWHYECREKTCERVAGAGPAGKDRQCSPGQEENVCWHRKCSENNTCEQTEGGGQHECDQDWGEQGCKHTDCTKGATTSITDNTCEVIPGKGSIGCPIGDVGKSAGVCWHSWCSIDTPGGRCAYWSGPGDVACHTSADCPGLLEKCKDLIPDWKCPTIPNPLKSCEEMFKEACKELLPDLSFDESIKTQHYINAAISNTPKARARLTENNQDKLKLSANNSKDPITIEVFQDITCGMCNYAFKNILPKVEENYVKTGKAKFVYKQFPLIPQGKSLIYAKAAFCADKVGKHNELVGHLFSKGKEGKVEEILDYAKAVGVDEKGFDNCLNADETQKAIESFVKEGEEKGVKGTPTFFIDGEIFVGAQPFEKFSAKLEEKLAK